MTAVMRWITWRLPVLSSRIDRGLLLSVFVALLVAAPLLDDRFFFGAHDAKHSVFFLTSFDRSVRDGVLWPRWQGDFVFGYGYPLFNFYPPIAFAVAEVFVLLGFGYVGAVKATFLLAIVGSAIAMYLLGRRLFGPPAGVIASVIYSFMPYHLLDRYVRSALAETVALIWIPLALWALLRLEGRPDADDSLASDTKDRRPTLRAIAVAAIALAGLVLTHTPTTLLAGIFIALFCVWRLVERFLRKDPAKDLGLLIGRYAASVALAVGLASIFLFPVVAEGRFLRLDDVTTGQFDFARHFVYPYQFLSPFWGPGYSDPGLNDTMGFQLGLAGLTLGAFALAGSPLNIPRRARRAAFLFAGMTMFWCFLMTPAAAPIWASLPFASLIQFPWRILTITAVSIAPLAGAAFAGLEARFPDPTSAVRATVPVVLGVAALSFGFIQAQPTPITNRDVTPLAVVEFELSSYSSATIYSEFVPTTSPMVADYRAGRAPNRWTITDSSASITVQHEGGESGAARINTPNGGTVTYLTFDFPGFVVEVDGQAITHRREAPLALIAFDLTPGEHTVRVFMGSTPARTTGTIVSVMAVLLTGLLLFWRRK